MLSQEWCGGSRIAQTVCQRYIDVVVKEPDALGNVREVSKEIKNLKADAPFSFGPQVKFDVGEALQESLRANGGRLVESDLARRLGQLEDVLRGSPGEMAAVVNGLRKKIEEVLVSKGAEQLAKHVQVTPLGMSLTI